MKINTSKRKWSIYKSLKKISKSSNFKKRLNLNSIKSLTSRKNWKKPRVISNLRIKKKTSWRGNLLSLVILRLQTIIVAVIWVLNNISMFWAKKKIWIKCFTSASSLMRSTCKWCLNSILNNYQREDQELPLLAQLHKCHQWLVWCHSRWLEVYKLLNLTKGCSTLWLVWWDNRCQWEVKCQECKWHHPWEWQHHKHLSALWFLQTFLKISTDDNDFHSNWLII